MTIFDWVARINLGACNNIKALVVIHISRVLCLYLLIVTEGSSNNVFKLQAGILRITEQLIEVKCYVKKCNSENHGFATYINACKNLFQIYGERVND